MKKTINRKIIYISMAITALIIAVGAFLLFTASSKNNNAEKAFEAYIGKWEKQDFKAMYSLLSKDTKVKITEKQFTDRYSAIYKGISAEKISIEIENNKLKNENKDSINIPFSITMDTAAGTLKVPGYEATLVKEKINGKSQWTVQWNENMIFPNMEVNDKVRVNTIKANRGELYDRAGKGLAVNLPVYTIGIQPVSKFLQNKDANTAQLAKILDIDPSVIENKLKDNSNLDQFIAIAKVSSLEKEKAVEVSKINGICYQQSVGRVYPGGEAFGSLIGYIGPITAEELGKLQGQGYSSTSMIGKAGLEQVYENRLKGEDGAEIYISKQKDGKEVQKITLAKKEAKDGENIKLCIDFDLQKKIYATMNRDAGACTAINPTSGEVLALVSSPSYDSNAFTCYATNSEKAAWKSGANPFQNRFKNAYAPGSTFKLLTAALGLSQGKIKPEEEINIQGTQWQPNKSWGAYKITRVEDSNGPVNLKNAFVHSDNIYFAMAALNIGKDEFIKGCSNFGIGEALPIDYPIAKSQLSNNGTISSDEQLADSGYGQGQVLMSPLHVALMYSSIVNDGNIMTPILEYANVGAPKVWKENVISKDNLLILVNDLTAVIEDPSGTGHGAQINGLSLAGKTGTAEVGKNSVNDVNGKENGWFVCMNTDTPKIVVSMIIEDVKSKGGSHYVVPKVRDVMDYYLKQGGGKN